jgi:DNA-binding HxlR family transcriptional regulator
MTDKDRPRSFPPERAGTGSNRRDRLAKSPCPVARTTRLIGDQWTLLILRNAVFGMTRYEQFKEQLNISRATLSERLNTLVDEGFFTREPYQDNPARFDYLLTEKGRAFFDVVAVMWTFGEEWLFDADHPSPLGLKSKSGSPIRPIVIDESTGEPLDCREVRLRRR